MSKLKEAKPVYIALDLETTGLDVTKDCIVSACIKDVTKTIDEYELVNPGTNIPENATKIHKITNDDVANAITERNYLLKLKEILYVLKATNDEVVIITYNGLTYDLSLLFHRYKHHNISFDFSMFNYIDMKYEACKHDLQERNSLRDVYERETGDVENKNKCHEANYDVYMTLEIFKSYMDKGYPLQALDSSHILGTPKFDNTILTFGIHHGKTLGEVKNFAKYMGYLKQIGYIS